MMSENEYYIIDLPCTSRRPYGQLLFGKFSHSGTNLRFDGITIEGNNVENYIRDTINHTLSPDVLNLGNALKINKRTYEVVLSWFLQLIDEIKNYIKEIPKIESVEQSVVICANNNIIVTPYGNEIAEREDYIRSMAEENIQEWNISTPNQYVAFPSFRQEYGCQNLDTYWSLMQKGYTKFITNTMCDMLTATISHKIARIISQIKHIHKYRQLYY